MRKISVEEFHAELKAQGVSSPQHVAVICPVCDTPQSKALLAKEGCPEDKIESQIGFSCVGRWNGAGDAAHKTSNKPGCNWTLGGLFTIHKLEVEKDGEAHPMFETATPEQAQALEAQIKAAK